MRRYLAQKRLLFFKPRLQCLRYLVSFGVGYALLAVAVAITKDLEYFAKEQHYVWLASGVTAFMVHTFVTGPIFGRIAARELAQRFGEDVPSRLLTAMRGKGRLEWANIELRRFMPDVSQHEIDS